MPVTQLPYSQLVCCVILAVFYLLLFVTAVVLLVMDCRSQLPQMKLRRLFHWCIAIFGLIRVVFYFILAFGLKSAMPTWLYFILWSLPGDILFTTYSLLVFFWADTYYHCHGRDGYTAGSGQIRLRVLVVLNVILYLIQVLLFIIMPFFPNEYNYVQPYFFSVVALISVFAFIAYGLLLVFAMRNVQVQSAFRRRKMQRILFIVTLVAITFVIRAVVNFIWPPVVQNIIYADGFYWVFILPFYFIVELLPTFLILFIITRFNVGKSSGRANKPTVMRPADSTSSQRASLTAHDSLSQYSSPKYLA